MNTRFNLPEPHAAAVRDGAASQICNAAEWLLHVESIARVFLRYGASLQTTADCLEINSSVCELALDFVAARDSLKLRALVEDWDLPTISAELESVEANQKDV